MRPDISLVIASYNSVREIKESLRRLQAYFEKQPYSHEIIIVDDGSSDHTEATLGDFSLRYPELKVLGNSRNMGKGYSIKKGVLEAKGRFILYTDADLAYPIEGIEAFLLPLWMKSHDVIVGSRVHAASLFYLHPRYFRYVYKRHLMSRFFNWVVRAILGIRAVD
ncbi:MAG: glycosyltransferase, partial [candidate division NC10 bacterium]|nr:glycosyltransferase [candidate division NC10 bacterium]